MVVYLILLQRPFRINSDEFHLSSILSLWRINIRINRFLYEHNGQVNLLAKQKGNSNRINKRLSRRRIYHRSGRCTIYYKPRQMNPSITEALTLLFHSFARLHFRRPVDYIGRFWVPVFSTSPERLWNSATNHLLLWHAHC